MMPLEKDLFDLFRRPHQPWKTKSDDLNEDEKTKLDVFVAGLKGTDQFSIFIPSHRKIAVGLINYFQHVDVKILASCAAYGRTKINPNLFTYAVTIALLNREDTKHYLIPSYIEYFPDRFYEANACKH